MRVNPYGRFVSEVVRALEAARSYPLGGVPTADAVELPADAPKVLVFSPHPDDECIIGALPLRLLRERRMRVVNVAVTLGSRRERRTERLAELTDACRYLGFELLPTQGGGLENINPRARREDSSHWSRAVGCVAEILAAHRPAVVFFPHADDGNRTHMGTHLLVTDALRRSGKGFSCHVVETEYWRPMADPNLLVESSPRDVTDLVTALSFHVGEVRRNQYHLRLPAWMIDNVRRGGETVGEQGAEAPDFLFATLYRHSLWRAGEPGGERGEGRYLSADADLSFLSPTGV
jgi:LmbE family N-acetylglucosaminyl deacetylase